MAQTAAGAERKKRTIREIRDSKSSGEKIAYLPVPDYTAAVISKQLEIPTIGLGAAVDTDAQILLCHDLLGGFTDFKPKFTKRYANLSEVAVNGIEGCIAHVRGGTFAEDEHSYGVDEKEYEKYFNLVERRRHQ